MKLVLWFRALKFLNWRYWNYSLPDTTEFVLQRVSDIKLIELRQKWEVIGANRVTGKVVMRQVGL